ncbi:hypothetical protein [Chloroflexus sp.]|uniref:hypothetical protein n=1 Tax=Chloroflexus sp. TaxID=1904827 RepID=UPI00298F0752|nr:hypothetical protein [Chloroflexus sp.]MDW8405087.1 hypothetical protein [Chloroflexus sp.]
MTATTGTLADEVWRLMTAQGILFAVDAPIRQTLQNLVEFFVARWQRDPESVRAELEAALAADDRFTREEVNGQVIFVTSRQGRYVPRDTTDTHTFKQRLYEPEKPLPIDDLSVVVSTSRPAITTVEPVYISDYWIEQARLIAAAKAAEQAPVTEEPAPVAAASERAPVIAEQPVVEAVPPVDAEPAQVAPVIAETAEVIAEPVVVAEPVEAAPAPAQSVSAERSTILVVDGMAIDLSRSPAEIVAKYGPALERILAERLEQDPLRRIVSFGRMHYPEASLISFGKNDLRKIRDYILERNEPLLDTEIIADLYYHNPRQSDYEGFRFSLNYRLSREKDFEFVGVEGANVWSTKGLPAIGSKRVKAAEMGQLTAYLIEGFDDSLADQSVESIVTSGSVTRLLTFFEWEFGVLPLDAALAALLPKPVFPDQRSAVLRFESPQHFSTYLVEVRYPTGNRGGWLQGLEDFFREHLVPGALITISRSEAVNVFTITYEEASETTGRLLTLDEKKNKFAFANMTFYCAVDEDLLPEQNRYGKLRNLKAFPMGERRKAEMILEHVCETMGERGGSREQPVYRVAFADIFMAYNVLRPASRSFLLALLANNPAIAPDPAAEGVYLFTPPQVETEAEVAEEEEDLPIQPALRRRSGRYIEEDE